MDLLKPLKTFWIKVFLFSTFFQSYLSVENVESLFVEYGFNLRKTISLTTDLPYWGQTINETVEACGKVKSRNITTSLQFYDKGIRDAVGFLCSNLKDYKGYISCFNNTDVNKAFMTCKEWRDSATKVFNNTNTLDYNYTKCSIEDVYQSCTISMVQNSQLCGKNASKWFDSWWRKINYYYHLSISCISTSENRNEDQETDEWSIILGIILAVTACLLVVGIIVFVIFLFSRRKNHSNDDDPTHTRGPRGFGQRREVPPPYALVVETPGENTAEGELGGSTGALRLVDRENGTTVETEARLYDGNISNTNGNGLILPPPYSGSGLPPDVFGIESGGTNDSDKEDEMMSVETNTTPCSSINLHATDSNPHFPFPQTTDASKVSKSASPLHSNQVVFREAKGNQNGQCSGRRTSFASASSSTESNAVKEMSSIKNKSLPSIHADTSSEGISSTSLV